MARNLFGFLAKNKPAWVSRRELVKDCSNYTLVVSLGTVSLCQVFYFTIRCFVDEALYSIELCCICLHNKREQWVGGYCLQLLLVEKCVQIKWEMPKKVKTQQQREQKRGTIGGH